MNERSEFQPKWFSPPGATIADLLSENSMSVATFADLIGESHSYVGRLLAGDLAIDEELAASISNVLGSSKEFWLRREMQYQASRRNVHADVSGASPSEWLARLPISDMKRFGWIVPSQKEEVLYRECLKFFDVPNLAAWEATYRPMARAAAFRLSKSYVSNTLAQVTWLRSAERLAGQSMAGKYSARRLRELLPTLRRLVLIRRPSAFYPKLKALCAECGVATVVVPTPAGCPASGATRILSNGTAMIALSFRYKSDDQFWFTFFHEVGHLLLHEDSRLFFEDGSDVTQSEEDEANTFSAELLVPDSKWEQLRLLNKNSKTVIRFAVSIGTSPGIVVGQMQYKGYLRYNQLNFLKRRLAWEGVA